MKNTITVKKPQAWEHEVRGETVQVLPLVDDLEADTYKERVIRKRLVEGGVDAIAVCGTNLASLALAEKLELELDIPIVGINPALLWYVLRENGITAPLVGASRLLREF